ncbi:MAG: extracellular solute-binding protein [Proteobacteria bacterium]|nr:extracellular solute-binding protein [Pseudomonadota bacterium]
MLIKIVSLIFWLCSAESAQAGIIFWHQEIGDRDFVSKILKDFQEQYGIAVEATLIATDHYKSTLTKQVQRGALPDVIFCPGDYVSMAEQLNLSPLPNALKVKDISSDVWVTTTSSGKLYGLPVILGNHLMLFYNKLLVKGAPTSWSQFAQGRKTQDPPVIGWNFSEMYWFAPFIQAYGSGIVKDAAPNLNTPAMVQALKTYKKFADEGLVDRRCSYDCASKDFYDGKYPYAIDGDWALSLARQKLGKNLGLAKLPSLDGHEMPAMYSTMGLLFPGKSLSGPKREQIIKLARFLVSDSVQGDLWRVLHRIPVLSSARKQFEIKANQDDKVILGALAAAKAMPSDPAVAYSWEAMRRGFLRYLGGQDSAEYIARYMQVTAESELSNRKEKVQK